MPAILSKIVYAQHAGVTPGAVSQWIARGQLTAPALQVDGLIDVVLADRQLAETLSPARSRLRFSRVLPPNPAMIRAEALASVYTAIELGFLAPAVAAIGLSPGQCEQLGRHWLRFRARASRSG